MHDGLRCWICFRNGFEINFQLCLEKFESGCFGVETLTRRAREGQRKIVVVSASRWYAFSSLAWLIEHSGSTLHLFVTCVRLGRAHLMKERKMETGRNLAIKNQCAE